MNRPVCRGLLRTALAVCLFGPVCLPAAAQPKVEAVPQTASAAPTVSVIGEAVARVHPDIALLTFGVEIRDPNTTQSVSANQRMTKKVVELIEKGGIATSDITVGPYRMEHVVNTFIPALGTNQPVEFQLEQHGTYLVTSDIVVSVRDIANVASVIHTALVAGVDRIERVRYESSRLAEVKAGLVKQAISDARQKAERLARDAGMKVGDPLHVTQLPDNSTSVTVADGNTVSGQTSPPILQVRLRVRVVYAATKDSG